MIIGGLVKEEVEVEEEGDLEEALEEEIEVIVEEEVTEAETVVIEGVVIVEEEKESMMRENMKTVGIRLVEGNIIFIFITSFSSYALLGIEEVRMVRKEVLEVIEEAEME